MRDLKPEATPVMIIRSNFVGDDPGRVRHLLDAENNERVVARTDLDRGCPADLDLALEMYSALGASNVRAKNRVAHIKCSPFLALDEAGLLRMLEVVEREHGIPADQPRKVIVHHKGNRPFHVHLLYAAVNPATGRVLSSKLNYQADELASRILEIEFGEDIVPGPRIRKNEEALAARGEAAMAAILSRYEPVRNRNGDTENDRQQGARTKMPPKEFRRRLANALASTGAPPSLPRALGKGEFAIAVGDRRKVLMLVHLRSGAAYSLERTLAGMALPPLVDNYELARLRAQARPLAEVVRDGLVASHRRAEALADREIRRGAFETVIDGEVDTFFSRLRRQRDAQPKGQDGMSLRALRAATRAAERLAQSLHQRRIDRAFRAARILQSPRARKAAFALAASGALLAGGSFAMAVGAGVLATIMLKDQAMARREEAYKLIASRRRKSHAEVHRLRPTVKEPDRSDNTPSEKRAPPAFEFDSVPREQRILAGIAMHHMSMGWNTALTEAVHRALGRDIMAGLQTLHRDGSESQKSTVANWAKGARKTFGAASALRRAGELAAAVSLEQQGRRLTPRSRERGKGRG